ncbi:MAG: regulatory protein GemA [Notoacmeibacter sp.]|nr:regulatory protein GemA [Notoacmeibacter sp.]
MTALRAIHVGCRQLGLDEDMRRGLYVRVTGKASAKDMSEAEQRKVVEELRRQGFKQASKGSRKALEGKFAKKLQALWIGAWNLGLVRNRDDAALLAFVKRQTGLDHTRFLHHAQDARAAIEALKAWMARGAGVDWTVERARPDWTQLAGYRIAQAQSRLLHPHLGDNAYLQRIAFQRLLGEIDGQYLAPRTEEANWIPVMNELGERVRAMKGG